MDFSVTTVFPIVAFAATFLATRIALGWGFSAVITVGYFHGIVRANILSVYTTFMFDAAVFGLYCGLYLRPPAPQITRRQERSIVSWVTVLVLWPLIITSIPVNDILVQFVAFRATAWLLPMLWIGTRLSDGDLRTMALCLAGLNLIAIAFGMLEYVYGVEPFYPQNLVTITIYNSNDIAGGYLRIPSTFLNSHSYGGTMVNTLPFLLGELLRKRTSDFQRFWLLAGTVAACGGALLCGARQPLVVAGILFLVAWGVTGFSPRVATGLVVGLLFVIFTIGMNERLQRIATLSETAAVSGRIRGSLNEKFLDLLTDYPLGAGMGSSAGTSIPFFLATKAPKKVGLENEYCRILIDQGWIGLLLWGGFLVWAHWPPPKRTGTHKAEPFVILMYALSLSTWGTAFIGTGLLTSIPGTVLLLTQMGVVIARRQQMQKTLKAADFHPLKAISSTTSDSTEERITVSAIRQTSPTTHPTRELT